METHSSQLHFHVRYSSWGWNSRSSGRCVNKNNFCLNRYEHFMHVMNITFHRIGRKLAFTLSVLILGSSMLGAAFSVNFHMFCAMRFFCGVSCVGLFDIAFVWGTLLSTAFHKTSCYMFYFSQGIESVGKKYKIMCGLTYQIVFSIGACLLGLVAYYVRNWRTLQLVISVPILLMVTTYW